VRLARATWADVERYLQRSRGVVIPAGSTEQHGPIGLIGTDAICAEAVADGLAEAEDALVTPAIAFGAAQFNLAFPGTVSVRATTLIALVEDVVRSLARQGFERFYFLNGHGGNLAPLRCAFQDLYGAASVTPGARSPLRFRVRSWWEYPAVDRLRRERYGEWEGMHATPSEVAITAHLFPAAVRSVAAPPPERLSAEFLREHAGDQHPDAATHRARFPDGRVGSDSSLASAAAGADLLTAAIADARADYAAFMAES
jgi:creatinine amidohydrolase